MMTIKDRQQVDVYSDSDTTVYYRFELFGDDVSDLPAPTDISGCTIVQGSTMHIISTAEDYQMQSDGTWVLQQGTDLSSIISQISQIESDLQDAATDATWAKTQVDNIIYPALISLIDRGAKNALDLSAAQTVTDAGVTFTVNADSSITCTGQATATAWIHVPVTIPPGQYTVSGMPEDGSTSTYRIDFRPTPTGTLTFVLDTETPKTWTVNTPYTGYFNIRVGSGYDFGAGVTVNPMLSQPEQYKISDAYVPYSPTNRELLELIRSYHP